MRPAVFAGLAAAMVSIVAALLIRAMPSVTSLVTNGHLVVNLVLFAAAGAFVARRGGTGWRAGLLAGALDALLGHPVAFLLSAPPDGSVIPVSPGTEVTPELIASMHRLGALVGAGSAVVIAAVAGAAGAWLVRRRGRAGGHGTRTG
jgi:hypothetical protein